MRLLDRQLAAEALRGARALPVGRIETNSANAPSLR